MVSLWKCLVSNLSLLENTQACRRPRIMCVGLEVTVPTAATPPPGRKGNVSKTVDTYRG